VIGLADLPISESVRRPELPLSMPEAGPDNSIGGDALPSATPELSERSNASQEADSKN
jgi:hypothetical protein